MHVLDLIMYIVGIIIIIYSLPAECKEEIGGIVGMIIVLIYTIIYVVLFGFMDYNMVEVLPYFYSKIHW